MAQAVGRQLLDLWR